ncbi:LysR family transcriptional regulator [Acidocella aromatica]|uniref:DNA-binding transcriptional LysR family regulator n=1 Tax=Acidocella aromatica TaxID=1303579 RepID=A0A840VAK0_9PROT|nr:LysR family transcriptional regulator [Acidocella aromatica]MBB5372736.1 DNA-binding transcriptional LysR family regulator [Acidocella aromatica]
MDLQDFDLNLLLVFDQMLKKKRVSRVAEALGVTQPAISRSLKRLRALLGDELFHRTATGMEPTAYAEHLAATVRAVLDALHNAINQKFQFDPKTSSRNFTIRMTDIGELMILPRLLQHLSREAPGVSITIIRGNNETLKTDMETGQVDLAIGLIETLEAGFFRRQIFKQGYVCVFRPDHPLAGKPLTLEDFERAEHAVVTAAGTGHARIDELIEAQGIKRKVKLRIPNYASLERLLQGSEMIATVPEALVQTNFSPLTLSYARHPVSLPRLPIEEFWHARFHRDPANEWLRNVIAVRCALPAIEPLR